MKLFSPSGLAQSDTIYIIVCQVQPKFCLCANAIIIHYSSKLDRNALLEKCLQKIIGILAIKLDNQLLLLQAVANLGETCYTYHM
jgi:hypothetical protein